MNMVEQAEKDLSFTLEDSISGFGVALQFQDNSQILQNVICQTTDIGFFYDMDTEAGAVGKTVEVVARLSTLNTLNIPTITKSTVLKYVTTAGDIFDMNPLHILTDTKIGVVKLILEVLKDAT